MLISEFKSKISNRADIEKILESIGGYKITYHNSNNSLRCAVEGYTDTATSLRVSINTLNCRSYSINLPVKGDLIQATMTLMNMKFTEAIKFMANVCGFDIDGIQKDSKIELEFGGYWKNVSKHSSYNMDLKTYDESILNDFPYEPYLKFTRDGILPETQKKFNVGYDLFSNRTTVPWRDSLGRIIGVMGRYCGDHESDSVAKYLPLISFEKSKTLFGLYENYDKIVNGTVFVVESEKGVMQIDSFRFAETNSDTGEISLKEMNSGSCGVGSHNMTPQQISILLSLHPKHIILAYDEDVGEEFLIETCENIKKQLTSFHDLKLGYLYDSKKEYLKKDSKLSPTDLGGNKFKKLFVNCYKKVL